MARHGRSYPVPARQVGPPSRAARAVLALPAFEVAAEFPALTVSTPDARVLLGAFEVAAEFPALTFSYGQHTTLPAFEVAAEFPALTVSTPVLPGDLITGDYQIEYGGRVFGGYGNTYQVLAGSVEGWDDLPSLDSGNVARPSRHGSWAGRKLSQERQVSAIIGISVDANFASSLAEIRRIFVPGDDETETALVVSGRDEILLAYAAVDARVIPTREYHQGWAPVSVRWTCSDPRRYGVSRNGVTVPVGVGVQLFNSGNVATHPLIRIPGPAAHPVLTNSTLGRVIEFSITLAAGELLDIDTDVGTVAVGDTNQMSTLTGASVGVQDFVLGAGVNVLTFTAASGGGDGADLLWRDAHL